MQIRRNIQGTFRQIPSSVPIRIPVTNHNNVNIYTQDMSNYLNITQNLTPPKFQIKKKFKPQSQTLIQVQRFNKQHLQSIERQNVNNSNGKDQLIRQLRKIIDLMKLKPTSTDNRTFQHLNHQIQVLTIQNQKLLSLLDKNKLKTINFINKQQHGNTHLQTIKEELLEAQSIMAHNQKNHDKEMECLLKSHKSLAKHCRDLENEKQYIEKQNKKLIKLLKQKDESQRRLFLEKIDQKNQNDNGRQKLSIIKIKQQHLQNINLLKISFTQQIQSIIQQQNIIISNLNQKIDSWEFKLNQLEKPKESHYKKSEIYIQEAPQSQRIQNQTNKLSGSQIYDIDEIMKYNKKDKYELYNQLQQTKKELAEVRFKYEKICLDTSTTCFSKRPQTNQQNIIKEKNIIEEQKNQIFILKNQITHLTEQKNKIMDENEHNIKTYWETSKKIEEQQKAINTRQMNLLKEQTEMKVKQLMNIHLQEVEILKTQINNKNIIIKQMNLDKIKKQNEFEKEVNTLRTFANHLQHQYGIQKNELQQKAINNQLIVNQFQIKYQNLSQKINSLKQSHQKEVTMLHDQILSLKSQNEKLKTIFNEKLIQESKNKEFKIKNNLLNYKNQMERILIKLNIYKGNDIVEDLVELKNLFNSQEIIKSYQELDNIYQLQQQKSILLESKTNELETIRKQNTTLLAKLMQNELIKIKLEEKVNSMEGIIELYVKTLQQLKILYEKLIQQKSKDIFLPKFQDLNRKILQTNKMSLCLQKVSKIIQSEKQRQQYLDKLIIENNQTLIQ